MGLCQEVMLRTLGHITMPWVIGDEEGLSSSNLAEGGLANTLIRSDHG